MRPTPERQTVASTSLTRLLSRGWMVLVALRPHGPRPPVRELLREEQSAGEVTVSVDELEVADPADAWRRAGFSVDSDAVCRVGGVRIRLVGRGRGTGIVGWSLRGLPAKRSTGDLDGIPTTTSSAAPAAPATHPNGVTTIDHVVLMSPDLNRTVESLVGIGVHPRRERDAELGGRPIRQIFFRLGEVIVEVVGSPETRERRTVDSLGHHLRRRRHRRDGRRSSVTAPRRSRTQFSPGVESPRSGTTTSGSRSGRR